MINSKLRFRDDRKLIFVCGASRTGTTLACALLDLNPKIKMLGEFIFPLEITIKSLSAWLESYDSLTGLYGYQGVISSNSKKLSAFVRRSGFSPQQILDFLIQKKLDVLNGSISDFRSRLWFSVQLANVVLCPKGNDCFIGLKLNNSQIFSAGDMFPASKYLIISREPEAIVESQIANKMSNDAEFSEKVIQNYYGEYFRFLNKHPDRAEAVSLELLSRAPVRALSKFFSKCGLFDLTKMESEGLAESEMLSRGHINSKSIRSGVRAVGRRNNLRFSIGDKTKSIFPKTLSLEHQFPQKRYGKSFEKKRKLFKDQYLDIIERVKLGRKLLTLRDLNRHCIRKSEPTEIGYVRHDIDHDLDNAVKLAELDANLGVPATYCVLHTAPYYGFFDSKSSRYQINDYCVDAIRYIQSLGHEINFHNNLIVMAARQGINPAIVLENELQQWWNLGVAICGTSTHGDKLCKEFGFRNWELFKECDLRSNNEEYVQIMIEDEGQFNKSIVTKRCLPMKAFALEYEAYDFPKTIYVSDSGGNPREHEKVRGHSAKSKIFEDYNIFGVLTHPIWWNLND